MQTQDNAFPTKTSDYTGILEVKTKQSLGATAKVWLNERARRIDGYYQTIQCEAQGKSRTGEPIHVNTLGRWLFGVPGYQGNLLISTEGEVVSLGYSSESPTLAKQFLHQLKELIENQE
ncbi:hypothetical protein KBC79_03440 [Candidatus Woesebacteria bacterium]|nr:hypothetical protein [Candidatus Woesebacteria bacterium]